MSQVSRSIGKDAEMAVLSRSLSKSVFIPKIIISLLFFVIILELMLSNTANIKHPFFICEYLGANINIELSFAACLLFEILFCITTSAVFFPLTSGGGFFSMHGTLGQSFWNIIKLVHIVALAETCKDQITGTHFIVKLFYKIGNVFLNLIQLPNDAEDPLSCFYITGLIVVIILCIISFIFNKKAERITERISNI